MLTCFFDEALQCLRVAHKTLVQSCDAGDTARRAASADFSRWGHGSQLREQAVASKKPMIECAHAKECSGEGGH